MSANQPSLGQYGKHFQECVMQALLSDQKWAELTLEVFNPDYFELKYLQFLSKKYFAYAQKYRVFPTLQLLATIIKEDLKIGTDVILRDQIIDYLMRVKSNPDPGDLGYVKDKTLDFCRKQALKHALEEAVDQMQAEKYESIVDNIRRAVSVGTVSSVGHDFFTDYEARFTLQQRNAIPTGLDEIDRKEVFNGGIGKGELGCVIGATGAGKSHFLTMLGANALRRNYNVLHYTFELSETLVGIRYDSNLCDIESTHVIDNKELVLQKYKDMKMGRLIIKNYPANSCTIQMMRGHMERLSLKGFDPQLVLVDYADIMRSSRQYDSLRHELKLVHEELRALADEKGISIWTASQSNKEGTTAEVIDTTNMSEGFGKAFVDDIIVTLSRRLQEKASGWGRLCVAKNRAGIDGLVYPVKVDTARSTFKIMGPAGSFEETFTRDEDATKKALRQKWNELKNDPKFQKNSLKQKIDEGDE